MGTSHSYACDWDICPKQESLMWLMSFWKLLAGSLIYLSISFRSWAHKPTCIEELGSCV